MHNVLANGDFESSKAKYFKRNINGKLKHMDELP